MREILFRAKRIDNGELVSGYYVYDYAHNAHFIFKNQLVCPNCINDRRIDYSVCDYEIDPDTLCQYTGLTDKNGSMIWENDIVRIGANTLVRWSEKYAGWCLIQRDWIYEHFFGEAFEAKDCEVVGNIFDNPELMEK